MRRKMRRLNLFARAPTQIQGKGIGGAWVIAPVWSSARIASSKPEIEVSNVVINPRIWVKATHLI